MRFNLRLAIFFGYLASLSICAALIPYSAYQWLTRGLATILFALMLILAPKVHFKIASQIYNIFSNFSESILRRIKFLGGKEEANYVNMGVLAIAITLLYAVSFIPCASYQSIAIGVFSSSLGVMFTYIALFKYEKKRFIDNTLSVLYSGSMWSKSIIDAIEDAKSIYKDEFYPNDKYSRTICMHKIDFIVERIEKLHNDINKWLALSWDYEDMQTLAMLGTCYICQSTNCSKEIKKNICDSRNYLYTKFHDNIHSIFCFNRQYIDETQKSINISFAARDFITAYLEGELLKANADSEINESIKIKNEEFIKQKKYIEEQLDTLLLTHQNYRKTLHEIMENFFSVVNMKDSWDAYKKRIT